MTARLRESRGASWIFAAELGLLAPAAADRFRRRFHAMITDSVCSANE
jgi:hypothetical protein